MKLLLIIIFICTREVLVCFHQHHRRTQLVSSEAVIDRGFERFIHGSVCVRMKPPNKETEDALFLFPFDSLFLLGSRSRFNIAAMVTCGFHVKY